MKPNDRFCDKCGHAQPTPELLLNERHVKEATGAMNGLAILFTLFGVVMFFVTRAKSQYALAQLAAAVLPIDGVNYTVADLRSRARGGDGLPRDLGKALAASCGSTSRR